MLNHAQVNADEEVVFNLKDMFVSKTDKKGLIQYGNKIFTDLSGYSNEELIGSPHNIIRHSHMPRAIFKLLWSYIKENKVIFAYVKNRAKSGRYYWVMAAVMPTENGYFSVRIKPTCGLLTKVEELYKETLSLEKDKGMDQALQFVNTRLQELGFSSYSEFMIHAMTEELASRDSLITEFDFIQNSAKDNKQSIQKTFIEMQARAMNAKKIYSGSVAQLTKYKKFKKDSHESILTITKSLPKLEHLSINMSIAANKLGKQGSTLAVVSSYFDKTSKEVVSLLGQIENLFSGVSEKLSTIIVNSSCSRLMIEMTCHYLAESQAELQSSKMTIGQQMLIVNRNQEMINSFNDFLTEFKPQKDLFLNETFELKKSIDLLIRNTSKLDLVKTGAKLESSNTQMVSESFQPFIQEIGQIIESINKALYNVKDQVDKLCEDFENINISSVLVEHTIQEISLLNLSMKNLLDTKKLSAESAA